MSKMAFLGHSLGIIVLTLISQLGGLAWAIALCFKRRIIVFVICYLGLWLGAMVIAPQFGRVPMTCRATHELHAQSWLYCLLNRNYVTPEMAKTLRDAARTVSQEYPGTQSVLLDGNFPFVMGFPLLPHLSHDDGEKADIAFYYTVQGEYRPGFTRSPIGYFAFEDGPTRCPKTWPTLRWNLRVVQSLWPKAALEPDRTRAMIRHLLQDPRVGKVFLEPHLTQRLGLSDPKLRFQGCRAARHDDHIHVQL